MTEEIAEASIEELKCAIERLQNKMKEKVKQNHINEISNALTRAPPDFVEILLSEIKNRTINPTSKQRKTSLYLAVKDGKVFLGDQEVNALRRDKKGRLRIAKTGKGAPPLVETQSDEIKKILNLLPIIN